MIWDDLQKPGARWSEKQPSPYTIQILNHLCQSAFLGVHADWALLLQHTRTQQQLPSRSIDTMATRAQLEAAVKKRAAQFRAEKE